MAADRAPQAPGPVGSAGLGAGATRLEQLAAEAGLDAWWLRGWLYDEIEIARRSLGASGRLELAE